ncbi:hypothetical protein L6J37_06165 [Photobacterium sp. WH77]|uniref:hypothetical protein n=1 Tax=unclassified Photobacterium TaxID=2628852 RepID=UPI001EDB88E1|nr:MULTISPECIES: hypothetical protein [unclassified Photobacterium]MCG2836449.1 hypothetical protein [Photobacterium sp. WH77]MCG2843924.1 hypothetical protein [Photobacterium sp. WH80]
MENSIGMLLVVALMLVTLFALNRFCNVMKEIWMNKSINWMLIFQWFVAFSISILLFLFLSENAEMLNIPVSPANPPIQR